VRITSKGQVTIPKRIRNALGLQPGDEVDFVVDDLGQVVVRRGGAEPDPARPLDGIDRARGSAKHKWGSTEAYMKFIRGDDYGEEGP
jgi:AbrB family looped-hinge helix DNA binding protein